VIEKRTRSNWEIVAILRVSSRLLALVAALNVLAFSQSAAQHASVTLISPHDDLKAGENWVGLRFQIDPGWHIYWVNPGDSGEPPKVSWHLPSGFQAGDLLFPIPSRIHDHSLIDYGYENSAVLLSKVTVPANAAGSADLSADVRWLVCRDVCIPGRGSVSLKLPVNGSDAPSANAGLVRTAESQLPKDLPRGVVLSGRSIGNQFVLQEASKTRQFGVVKDFFPLEPGQLENTTIPKIEVGKDMVEITVKKSEQLSQPIQSLRGILIVDGKAYLASFPISSAAHSGSRASSH
jgi:thiol:disulfide interchange protein DsbD